jgi:hypothetical protein
MTIVKLSVQQGVYHTLTNNSTNEAPFLLPPIALAGCAKSSLCFPEFDEVSKKDLKNVKFFFMGHSKPVDDSEGKEMGPEDWPEKMLEEGAAAVEAVYIRAVIPSATSAPLSGPLPSAPGESPQLSPRVIPEVLLLAFIVLSVRLQVLPRRAREVSLSTM